MRLLKFIFGTKPEVGNYSFDRFNAEINEDDINEAEKVVRIRFEIVDDVFFTFREFHMHYSKGETLKSRFYGDSK